ncbi:MAG: GNAT family N-acetyltransferase [Clostridia bacterium]|nr:GNAT family N-acetyltransferase [Clostridia bacterium]
MRLERLSTSNAHLFEQTFKLYQSSFPVEERRDDLEQQRVLKKEDYHFDLIMKNDSFIGVMLYWETENFVFLEHFTTLPELRGKGYGKEALDLLKEKNKIILLEIEPPVDNITQRRYAFYKRNGFFMNPYHHIQAKYHLGDEDLELKVLTYPRIMEKDEYRSFYEYMTREIGINPNVSQEITVRKLQDGDDINQVAKLIYLTDPYVYPNWFDSIDDGIKVIRQMIDLPTLYNRENITVAVTHDGFVAGVIVSKQTPFVEEISHIKQAFKLAGVKIDERTDFVFDAYYAKMGMSEDGYYIANVAVDENYRKRGIAAAMMSSIIEPKSFCTLECVVANTVSLRLYQRMGYKIAFEYPGVHGIPCYKMYYQK